MPVSLGFTYIAGFWACPVCSALVANKETAEKHLTWHKHIDEAIARNRPDPRMAFIGG